MGTCVPGDGGSDPPLALRDGLGDRMGTPHWREPGGSDASLPMNGVWGIVVRRSAPCNVQLRATPSVSIRLGRDRSTVDPRWNESTSGVPLPCERLTLSGRG